MGLINYSVISVLTILKRDIRAPKEPPGTPHLTRANRENSYKCGETTETGPCPPSAILSTPLHSNSYALLYIAEIVARRHCHTMPFDYHKHMRRGVCSSNLSWIGTCRAQHRRRWNRCSYTFSSLILCCVKSLFWHLIYAAWLLIESIWLVTVWSMIAWLFISLKYSTKCLSLV